MASGTDINDQYLESAKQTEQIRDLQERVAELEGHKVRKAWCLRHSEGWCANRSVNPTPAGQRHTRTLCGGTIAVHLGCEFREPTCEKCRKKLQA